MVNDDDVRQVYKQLFPAMRGARGSPSTRLFIRRPAGAQSKLINNSLLAANIGLADMALAAGAELGITKEALVELLQASSGRSFGLDVRARMPPPTSFAHGAALLKKDVRLLGEVLGADAPAYLGFRDAAADFLERALA